MAALLDSEGDLTPALHDALAVIFSRFAKPAPSAPLKLGERPHSTSVMDEQALDTWATATNGAPLPEEQKEELREYLDCDEVGNLTFKGFTEMYHLQTSSEPEETLRDLKAHGFGPDLKPLDTDTASKATAAPASQLDKLSLSARPATPSTDEAQELSTLVAALEAFGNSTDDGDEAPHDEAAPSLDEQRSAAQQLADELGALQSIYGDDSLHLLSIPTHGAASEASPSSWQPGARLRIALSTSVEAPYSSSSSSSEEAQLPIRISATLPPHYPVSNTAPQLQLLSRYIGDHGVDHLLFGEVLKAFLHSTPAEGVHFEKGDVVLFEAVEWVREKVASWYAERCKEREKAAPHKADTVAAVNEEAPRLAADSAASIAATTAPQKGVTSYDTAQDEPPHAELISAPALTERKSVFVGHAAKITDPSQVPRILSALLQDRKISRATHPAIYAWVCRPLASGTLHRDCDDDGESAAGGRLAHLLDVLGVENVLVVVTRWYGGVHLGADRFKFINRAARDALELAGVVEGPLNANTALAGSANGKGKKTAKK